MTKDEAKVLWVLEEAPEVIKEFGWHQGSYGDSKQGYCLMGAIDRAATRLKISPRTRIVQEAFAQVSVDLSGERRGSLSYWNDAPTTTKRKVLALLRKTAKRMRKEVTV